MKENVEFNVRKLNTYFTWSVYYKIQSQILENKIKKIQSETENYKNELIKKYCSNYISAEEKAFLDNYITKKVSDFKLQLQYKENIFELMNKMENFKEIVVVPNKNPLNDNMAPTHVCLLQNYYENLIAKYGINLFVISHNDAKNKQSSFDFLLSRLKSSTGKVYEDMTFVVNSKNGISAYKAIADNKLNDYNFDNYTFSNQAEFKKFMKKNDMILYHSREYIDKNAAIKYKNSDFDFNFVAKYVYLDDLQNANLNLPSQKILNSIWATHDYIYKNLTNNKNNDLGL